MKFKAFVYYVYILWSVAACTAHIAWLLDLSVAIIKRVQGLQGLQEFLLQPTDLSPTYKYLG